MVNRIERNKVIAANSARRRLQMYFNFELLAQFQLEVHGGQPLPQNLAASAVARDAGRRRARLASRRFYPGRDDTVLRTRHRINSVSYTHLRAHETRHDLVC